MLLQVRVRTCCQFFYGSKWLFVGEGHRGSTEKFAKNRQHLFLNFSVSIWCIHGTNIRRWKKTTSSSHFTLFHGFFIMNKTNLCLHLRKSFAAKFPRQSPAASSKLFIQFWSKSWFWMVLDHPHPLRGMLVCSAEISNVSMVFSLGG